MPGKPGLYANIAAKKKRIAAGSGEKMNKVGSKAAPSAKDFKNAAKTAKPRKGY
jgi:signal recognition particle GTPase